MSMILVAMESSLHQLRSHSKHQVLIYCETETHYCGTKLGF